jgi:hypothetical protein
MSSPDSPVHQYSPNNSPNTDPSLSPATGSPVVSTLMSNPVDTTLTITPEDQKKINTNRAIATEKQIELVLSAIQSRLHGESISKENLPGVIAASMLSLTKLKYNTPEQNRRVALEGLGRYLKTLQIDMLTKKELYADAETASDAAMYLYNEIQESPKSCCVTL